MSLLRANCISCHNPEKDKGGLQLTSRAAALTGGENSAALVPGKPEVSMLIKVLAQDADPHMPPKKQLRESEITLLKQWVAGGALWRESLLATRERDIRLGPIPRSFEPVYALAVSPSGDWLAIGRGNHLVIHSLTATNFPAAFARVAHSDAVRSIAWSPDGETLATGAFQEVAYWKLQNLEHVWTAKTNLIDRITDIEFTDGGKSMVIADGRAAESGWLRILAASNGSSIHAWQAHDDTINAIDISADGRWVATASSDQLTKLWDLTSRDEAARFEGHSGAVLGVSFHPSTNELVTVSSDKQLKIWDRDTREEIVNRIRPLGLNAAVWSPDGKFIVAATEDGIVYSYSGFERHTGAQSSDSGTERQLMRTPSPVHSLAITPDNEKAIVGMADGFVHIVSPDGKTLGRLGPSPYLSDILLSAKSLTNPIKSNRRWFGRKAAPEPEAPSFVRDVLPALAKAGCMAGSCHAKPEGQNGFKLSVFSFDPQTDYSEIVHDARGRRIFPAAPEESLLILKPTLAVSHEGGQRIEAGSQTDLLLQRWIRGGMVYQHTNEAALARIDVEPKRQDYAKGARRKLRVQATYSDGTTRDVTALADYSAQKKEHAEVAEDGGIRVGQTSGESVIVARYMGMVDAATVSVPPDKALPAKAYASLPANNFIDELAHRDFQKLGLLLSGSSSDAEFLRRSSLDTVGTLPTVEEVRAFMEDASPAKRERWIDRLLKHPNYADYWANKWADLLRPNPDRVGVKSVYTLDQWLREAFRENMPYDEFARAFVVAEGNNHRYGPAVVYRDRREPAALTTIFSQLFLGTRLDCAKCHHHPNEKWSQEDFYQFAAFFGTVKQKGAALSPPISAGSETFYFASGGKVKHPVTDAVMEPRALSASAVSSATNSDPREFLADWMVQKDNPFFAKAAVNRVWANFFGRGFVEPVDDFRASNPTVNEPLLVALSEDFARNGYDLKHLMRVILTSRLYQASSAPNKHNLNDTERFSRSYRRRLPAEVLLDAVSDVTGVPEKFEGCPPGSRAIQAWSYKIPSPFMDAFGRPNASSDCPCEREARPSIVQSLHMMNSKALQAKLSDPNGRVTKLATSKQSPEEIVTELYLAAYGREPAASELSSAVATFKAPDATRQTAAEDVLWALLNSAEFVFNH